MISIILILIIISIYLKLDKFYQYTLFSLSALFPLSFGDTGPIPSLLFIEWITIITFFLLINDLNPVYSNNKRIKILRYKGIEIFIFALIILAVLIFNSILQNEFFTKNVVAAADSKGVKRLYFNSFNNILIFFTTIIFVASYYDKFNFEKFFKIIVYFSVFVGILRIFSYFLKIDIPFLAGLFHYDSNPYNPSRYGGTAYRISGLDTTSIIGIPAFFAYYIYKEKLSLIVLAIFFLFVFLSGGRTVMIGVTISILVFSFFFLPKNFIYLIVAGGIIIIIFMLFVPNNVLQGQTGRLTTLSSGSFMGQDVSRGLAWKLYLENFIQNPIFGKGIGGPQKFILPDIPGAEMGIASQFAGGHGSYFSLLSMFGIAGITYFLIMVFGGIYLSFKKIKKWGNFNNDKTAIAVFCFMFLIIESINWITADNGLGLPELFYIVGFIASLTVIENNKKQQQLLEK